MQQECKILETKYLERFIPIILWYSSYTNTSFPDIALYLSLSALTQTMENTVRVVGPCHHGLARPQFADRGTASDMEGSCE